VRSGPTIPSSAAEAGRRRREGRTERQAPEREKDEDSRPDPQPDVIASPAFHRWHHSKDRAAIDRNFAGLFAFWDLLWGTFYLPNNRRPQNFGITDAMPAGVVGQLRYPFRRSAG
jgi:sterol desaturase/sphingolipid hydroxylase (fatty acid hydroxylase superfamily)